MRVIVGRAAESVEVVVLSQKVPGRCYLVQEPQEVGIVVIVEVLSKVSR